MAFDSLSFLASLALFAAGIGGWLLAAPLKAASRLYLRFAAILFAALAICAPLGLGDMAALFLLPLASAALVISALARFARPLNSFAASAVLVAALGCGLGAMLSGAVLVALAPAMLAGLVLIAAAANRVAGMAALSGLGLIAAGLCYVQQGAGAGLMLFCAAALVGLSRNSARNSALAVEQQALARAAGAIGGFQARAFAPLVGPGGHRLAQDLRDK
jgi:hypothetical protein